MEKTQGIKTVKESGGILLYRRISGKLEVFLVHPGGPYWAKKDDGAWSIPKGLLEPSEDSLKAAVREFEEETGFKIDGAFTALAPLTQPSGKIVYAWAVEGNCDAHAVKSNTFTMEWPPRSGIRAVFPEVDRGAWFPIDVARRKITKGQAGFLVELENLLRSAEEESFQTGKNGKPVNV